MNKLVAVACLLLGACAGDVLIEYHHHDAPPPPSMPDMAWRPKICAVSDNYEPRYIRENCLSRHTPNGLPCKVCVGFTSCASPILDLFCVNLDAGCQDPTCIVDR